MSSLGKKPALITQYIRNLRGGSQSILAQASDGLFYVVKFTNNPQGPNLPFNESIGSELYRACGLATPFWKPLLLIDAFIDRNPDCWMQTLDGRLRPASGLCFGSRFLGRDGARLFEILPGTSFRRVRNHKSFWLAWLIDICAGHSDNRQAIFLDDGTGNLDAFFVDHGNILGGPKGELRKHFLASRHLDPRIYQSVSSHQLLTYQRIAGSLDVDRLWNRVQSLPEDWKTASALTGLATCFNRLSARRLLQEIVATMVEAQRQFREHENRESQFGQITPAPVLLAGVPATRSGACPVTISGSATARAKGIGW